MAWVIDTCLLLDVLDDDPTFGESSARRIDRHQADGLTICPITLVELSPAFLGDWRRAEEFLSQLGVNHREEWCQEDTRSAFAAWHRHVELKRAGRASEGLWPIFR